MLQGAFVLWQIFLLARIPLAVLKDVTFAAQEMRFTKDDILLLYTDGVAEAMNEMENSSGTNG